MTRYNFAAALVVLAAATVNAQTPPATNSAAPHGLVPGQRLNPGERVTSPNGKCALVMQADGNLVWVYAERVLWHAATHGNPGAFCVVQTDGNLVVYTDGGVALWSTRTSDKPGAVLRCQDDGNLVLYQAARAVWTSTAGRTTAKIRFTRENTIGGLGRSLYLHVNGERVAENKSLSGSACVEVECESVRYGRNEVRVFHDAKGESPFYADPDGKAGHAKCFRVTTRARSSTSGWRGTRSPTRTRSRSRARSTPTGSGPRSCRCPSTRS